MKAKQYFDKDLHFIWNDGWHLEDNKAWFMAGSMDFLFCLDRNTKKTFFVDRIPKDKVCGFRQHPRCIKIKNSIICIPDIAQDIWFYHILDGSWSKIDISNPQEVRLLCTNAWLIQGRLYIISLGLKEIIEIDPDREEIVQCYGLDTDNEIQLTNSLLIGDYIYVVGYYPVKIYKFDLRKKETTSFQLSKIDDKIQTLCFDGDKFWLTGRRKRIYLWNEKTEDVTILTNLPEYFGIWNFNGKYKSLLNYKENKEDMPLFISSVCVENHIWLIPFQTNEILYIDKNTLDIKIFHIDWEEQTENELKRQLLQHKYLLQYVRDNRYIGLFSLKNKWVFEIDCREFKYEILNYNIDQSVMKDRMNRDDKIYEEYQSDLILWIRVLILNSKKYEIKADDKNGPISKRLYESLK